MEPGWLLVAALALNVLDVAAVFVTSAGAGLETGGERVKGGTEGAGPNRFLAQPGIEARRLAAVSTSRTQPCRCRSRGPFVVHAVKQQ